VSVAKARMVPRPLEASIVLFLAAEALVFVVIGEDSWPLVGAWALAAAGVLLVARFAHTSWLRRALAILLVAACVLLTTQAGLFFVPASVALLVAAFTHPRRTVAAS
jgi:cytochrome c oxidase subunit IV